MADNTTLPIGTGGDVIATDDIAGVKYQRVKPSWGSDGSAVDVDALNPLPISVNAANFIISTANSSTAQLTASSTFTGTIETALSQPSISILLTSDQPTTITVNQYIDLAGTRAAPNIVFTVAAGAGFSYSFTLNGNYVRVTAQNTGASTTTTFNLNVAYGTIQSANQAGNAPVDLASMGGVVVAGTAASTQPLFTTPALTVADRSTGASGATAPSSVQHNGAVFTSTLPTVTTGQMVAMQATARGEQLTALSVGAVQSTIKAASTAAATTDTALVVSFAGANSATRIGDGTNNVNIKAGSTAAVAADPSLVVALSPNTAVTLPAITKGTQGATGITVQALNDAGRNLVTYYTLIPVLATATDTLQSLTGTKSGATVTATTTPAVVTTGKTLRITRFSASYIATATSGYAIARLRFNTAGVVAITSPVAATLAVAAGTPATANSGASEDASIAEGKEFAAGTGIGISVQGFAAATATAVGYMFVSVSGYEY